MTETIFEIGKHTVVIHDPAETPEAKANRQKRLEKACVRFMRGCEYELSSPYANKGVQKQTNAATV
jgi:hypothetical protein